VELTDGENSELALLETVLKNVDKLKIIQEIIDEAIMSTHFDSDKLLALEEHAYEIEIITGDINKIHMDKINRWTRESLSNMWIILFIYLAFFLIGGLSIYAGHIILLKNVVKPIKVLAAVTLEFADGKLDKRVETDSQTEIGQLYQSFNSMAEKLQENDEFLRKFNEELEKKVTERTTELQTANKQLQKTQNALIRTEKIAAVGQIAAGVTHEIKNPLNSLSINAQMLLRDLTDKLEADSSVHESANLIKYEITRINNILEEFVKFAKFPEPQFFDNDMNQVIKEVVDLTLGSAKESGVTINMSLQKDIPVFKFDARQFKEVLINLSQNAIKAIKESGSLEIATAMRDDNIIIHVTDTGEGIPEKNLENIFSPFFSTKEGGMGLGLSIVQRIIESHGGKICCTSQIGEGTTFEITMPLERG
jgi:two-component system NtrC family sensor kinase